MSEYAGLLERLRAARRQREEEEDQRKRVEIVVHDPGGPDIRLEGYLEDLTVTSDFVDVTTWHGSSSQLTYVAQKHFTLKGTL